MSSDNTFVLFSTSACHLCEIAAQMLDAWRQAGLDFHWQAVDIADSDELFSRYGTSIPVLRDPRGNELFWPFDIEALGGFLQSGPGPA